MADTKEASVTGGGGRGLIAGIKHMGLSARDALRIEG